MKNSYFIIAATILLAACDAKVTTTDNCGDGFLDPGEACDGSEMPVTTCDALGYYSSTGPLRCKSDCTLDTSMCSSRCGDGLVQALYEQCEGTNLAGETCQSQGLGAGTLACTEDCHFDITGCEVQAVCGDDTISAPFEQCEEGNLDGKDCVSLGYYEGTLVCDAN